MNFILKIINQESNLNCVSKISNKLPSGSYNIIHKKQSSIYHKYCLNNAEVISLLVSIAVNPDWRLFTPPISFRKFGFKQCYLIKKDISKIIGIKWILLSYKKFKKMVNLGKVYIHNTLKLMAERYLNSSGGDIIEMVININNPTEKDNEMYLFFINNINIPNIKVYIKGDVFRDYGVCYNELFHGHHFSYTEIKKILDYLYYERYRLNPFKENKIYIPIYEQCNKSKLKATKWCYSEEVYLYFIHQCLKPVKTILNTNNLRVPINEIKNIHSKRGRVPINKNSLIEKVYNTKISKNKFHFVSKWVMHVLSSHDKYGNRICYHKGWNRKYIWTVKKY